jgi:glycosyltransferase involved in cell wall biosynthesis
MIHLIIREPIAYQRTLCQALSDAYKGAFVAWFAARAEPSIPSSGEDFSRRFISDVGFATLYRELRSDPQAVVILGGWSSTFAHKTLLMTQLLRIPVFIWTDHPHPRQRSLAFERGRKGYLRTLGRRTAGFLACGKPTAKHLENLGIAPEKITNFPYWIKVPAYWAPPSKCAEIDDQQPLHLIAVGRQVPVKNFEVAIKAVALANQDADRHLATLELVGDGPERQRLEALVESMGLAGTVKFSGWVENEQACQRIRDADALVITSRFDAYGVVVLEALANGRPVLASDHVVAALDRDDGKGAIFLHPAGNPEPLAQQIRALAKDRRLLKASSEAARANAEEWPLARAARILQPLLDRANAYRARQNPGAGHPGYEGVANRSAQTTSDPS